MLWYNFEMSTASSSRSTGWRILGCGKYPEIAATVQEKLRSLGVWANNFSNELCSVFDTLRFAVLQCQKMRG
jgi:hypothetical protein